jgi:hypothetical protein
MVEISEELIEAMYGRKVFVQIPEMVLAELPGSIAPCLQGSGERYGFRRYADIRASLADGRQSSTDR